jgi:hypothetical protein
LPGFSRLANSHTADVQGETPLPHRLTLADLLRIHLLDHLLEPNRLNLLNVLLNELPLHNYLLNDRLHVLDGLNELDRLDLHVLDLLLHGHNGGDHVVGGSRGEGEESNGREGEKELTHETGLRDLIVDVV